MSDRRNGQPAWAYEMEIELMKELAAIRSSIPSEEKIRHLARDEMGISARAAWSVRAVLISIGMLAISASTFLMTFFRGVPG